MWPSRRNSRALHHKTVPVAAADGAPPSPRSSTRSQLPTPASSMARPRFPDLRNNDDYDEVVALGFDLSPENLLEAYRNGIFPWPRFNLSMVWASPVMRGLLMFDELRVPRSLRQQRRRSTWRYSVDESFEQVIRACADAIRPDGYGTWITPGIVAAYDRFHHLGHAHSVEVWDGDELVGGLYGVEVDGVFAGESMFHRKPNASKLALLHLIDILRKAGAEWLDIQTLTPHIALLGGREVPRKTFLHMLDEARSRGLTPFAPFRGET